jgi:hypothetical protein
MNPHEIPNEMLALFGAWILGTVTLFAAAIMLWY